MVSQPPTPAGLEPLPVMAINLARPRNVPVKKELPRRGAMEALLPVFKCTDSKTKKESARLTGLPLLGAGGRLALRPFHGLGPLLGEPQKLSRSQRRCSLPNPAFLPIPKKVRPVFH